MVHLMKKKMENDFCVVDATSVADPTTGYYMLALTIILNHIKLISFSVKNGTILQVK